jgi:hypothetical protein
MMNAISKEALFHFQKFQDSNFQIIISSYWKRWKDKSNILEVKQRRREEWAATTIQRCYRACQVGPHGNT